MLVLSRKLGEKIVIGDNIVVTVVKIDRNQIRIGIEAPQPSRTRWQRRCARSGPTPSPGFASGAALARHDGLACRGLRAERPHW